MTSDRCKFEKLVKFLAEISECGNLKEEVFKFEEAIEKTGYGKSHFGIAKSDWDRIEIIKPEYTPYKYKEEGTKYYAEYYDGMQAPFSVCRWKEDVEVLEELLKGTSPVLYKMYLGRTEDEN